MHQKPQFSVMHAVAVEEEGEGDGATVPRVLIPNTEEGKEPRTTPIPREHQETLGRRNHQIMRAPTLLLLQILIIMAAAAAAAANNQSLRRLLAWT